MTVKNEMERQVAASVFEVNLDPDTTKGQRIDSSHTKKPLLVGVAVFEISITTIPTMTPQIITNNATTIKRTSIDKLTKIT